MLGMRSGTSKSHFALRSATVILAGAALRPPRASAQSAFAHGSLKCLYGGRMRVLHRLLRSGTSPLRDSGGAIAPTPTPDYAPSLRSPWRAANGLCRGSPVGGVELRSTIFASSVAAIGRAK